MSSDRVPKFFFRSPRREEKDCLGIIYRAKGGWVLCKRSNKCMRHVRFPPRGVFYYFMGGGRGGGEGITQGCRFPSVSNENSTRLPFSMQMKFMTRIYWIVTAIKRFSPSLVELASSSPSFKILKWNGKRSRFVNTKNIYIYINILSIGQI